MPNNGCRIVLDRIDGSRWRWTLTHHGEQYYDGRSETTPAKAAQAAESQLFRAEFSRRQTDAKTSDGIAWRYGEWFWR
jgi:hypothetical protein